MFKVRPWLLVAFLCVLSAAGASGATRKLLEAKYAVLLQVTAMSRCSQAAVATKAEPVQPATAAAAPAAPKSADEAAIMALTKAYTDHPHFYEYGGVIVRQQDGTFNASLPLTDGHADNTEIDEDPESYRSENPVVADYHTHPCLKGYLPGVFSPADLHSMRSVGHPGYILDECTGDVHYWAPGMGYDPVDPEDILAVMHHQQTAAGKVVGHIPVDGKEISL